MKDKKVFRIHIVFLIEGRLFIFLMILSVFFWPWLFVELIVDGLYWMTTVPILLFLLHVLFLKVYIIPVVIPMFFGKLTLSRAGVEYRCFFRKIFISWEECKYCGIVTYKSDIKDLYKTGLQYIFFSKKPYFNELVGKKERKKVNKDFIKFLYVTNELCEEILHYKNFSEIRQFLVKQTFTNKK